jgi:hypothetical protein
MVSGIRAAALVTEREFMDTLIVVARQYGWLVYHTWSSRHSVAGFPDLVLLRGNREVVAELKRVGKKPDKHQQQWIEAFQLAGRETFIWTPDDWDQIHQTLQPNK